LSPPDERPKRIVPDTGEGSAIIRSSWLGTAIFVIAVAVAAPITDARLPAAVVDLALFLGGSGVFLWALVTAAGRSREREIELGSLFLLDRVAPARVRRALLASLAVEVVVALGTAWISAALAFGCLVPMWALGHCGLWGARYGAWQARKQPQAGRGGSPKA
jgi:hypothetical protein